jgi:hypothetical protein
MQWPMSFIEMLYDNPVRFYRFSEGDIAAVRKAKGT